MADLESRWKVFRTGLLRSAGFPFEWLDELADETLEHHGTLLVEAHARKESARTDALRALWRMRGDTRPADMPVLNRAIRAVRRRKPVTESQADISAATAKWNIAATEFDSLCDSLRAELSVTLPAEYEREAGLLLKQVASADFKDAVLLSSPLSYETFCRASDEQGFRRSKDELTGYRFLQRFCAKNETGGSIGPVNLMLFGSPSLNSTEIRYLDDPTLGRIEYIDGGDGRRAERRTFLSYWAACEIGQSLVGEDWRVPDFTVDPGEDLSKLAAQIGTPEAESADRLIADVRRFARTPLEERPAQLCAITRDFSRLTNKPAWQGAGRLRGDRAVLYEEATGNIQSARVGPAGAQRLAERMATALEFLASLAIEKRAAGQSLLAQELARRNVNELAATEVRGMPAAPVPQTSLRERFLQLVDPTASCAEFSRRELTDAGLIRDDLDDWPIFGAADLMLTGPGHDVGAGPGLIILSELHHIWPTLGCWVRALWDDETLGNEELWRISATELAPAVPTLQEIVRHEKATDSSPYGHAVLCLDSGRPVPGAMTVPAERVVVRRWQNGFIGMHDPASGRDLWLLPEYDDSGVNVGGLINCAIPALHLSAFSLGPYTPRIVVDGVVIQRRRWAIGVADVPGAGGRMPNEREWLAIQIWRRTLGLPRRAYFQPDTEGKPLYLDFSSVLSVANFLRCIRPAQRVVLTEALPDPERLWLRTKDGTLTSEIRTLLWRSRRTV